MPTPTTVAPSAQRTELPVTDRWVKTTCAMCWNTCGIEAHVVDGVVREIRGNPDCPQNWGKTCAKGRSGHTSLYAATRVLVPLRRTNPKKGLGVDPGWQPIAWEDALDILTERLRQVRQRDPRGLVISTFDTRGQSGVFWAAWATAFGTPNRWGGGSQYFCGNGFHPVTYLTHGTWFGEPDLNHCRLLLMFGTQNGFVSNHLPMDMARSMAEARAQRLKLVVIDPVGLTASRGDEWIPIRPGTDAALALALANVLVNELGRYDKPFLTRFTNAPYLVAEDGHYARGDDGKPLVWDTQHGCPVAFDAADPAALALEGTYEANGRRVTTAFTLLKTHLAQYRPETAEAITTVPAAVIRRLAREFGEAAQIGATCTVDGVELPLRPACANWYRGATAHKHALLTGLAISLLNVLVGAVDVPGGHLGSNPVSRTPPLFWEPSASPDGLLIPEGYARRRKPPYPPAPVKPPERLDLAELCPVAPYGGPLGTEALLHPETYHLGWDPALLILARSNLLMTTADPEAMAAAVQRFPFVVCFTVELNETAELADLVLPDLHYLERLDACPNEPTEFVAAGPGPWYWMIRQPVAPPQGQARHWVEVLFAVADRLGFLDAVYERLNAVLGLQDPYRYQAGERYSWAELADRWLMSWFGAEHGLAWFQEHGVLVTGQKRVDEAYPRPFLTPRIPLYHEYLLDAGAAVKRVTEACAIPWDVSDYQPLPAWKPCPAFDRTAGGFDLFAVNFKLSFHALGYTMSNPALAALSERDVVAYSVVLNADTARRRGIREGDRVRVESESGAVVEAPAHLSQCVHPEVVGIPACFGRKSRALGAVYGKGAHFNSLLPHTLDRIDTLTAALDSCVRVRVRRA